MLNKEQIRRIYSMAAVLNMLDKENGGENLLHELVYSMTGCHHVSDMNINQYNAVLADLSAKANLSPPSKGKGKKKGHYKANPHGMSEGQRRKVFYLMHQLIACDEKPCDIPLKERLCGIIRKEFKIDVTTDSPFAWLTYTDGSKLIEILKCYCRSAEQKRMRGG